MCGYVHDPDSGDNETDVPAGTFLLPAG
ncbi:MAG: rubredoxin [Desulfomonilia bacterium]